MSALKRRRRNGRKAGEHIRTRKGQEEIAGGRLATHAGGW